VKTGALFALVTQVGGGSGQQGANPEH